MVNDVKWCKSPALSG